MSDGTDRVPFRLPVRVFYEDTDAAGVVYHANYLRYMERARTEWLRSLGFDQSRLATTHAVRFSVARLELDYRAPARLDDVLEVDVALEQAGRASFVLAQTISIRPGTVACRGRVRIACVDAGSFRPRAIPTDIITELRSERRSVTR